MTHPVSSTTRRRLRWRRFVERSTLQRHPVSLTRQRIGTGLLVALVLGFVWYAVATRDGAIRQRAIDFLTDVTAGEVVVDRAEFHMFGGTTLYGVRVSVPFSEQLDPSAVDKEAREIFSVRSLKLVHNTWRLLFGSLRVEHVIATRPKIVLTHNVDTGLRNWQLLSRDRTPGDRSKRRYHRPRITLRSAVAEVVSIYKDGGHEARTVKLDADVRPHLQLDTAFSIEVRRFTNPAERTTMIFDPGTSLVTNTPFVDAQTIRLQLPKPAQQFFDRIALRGEVKLSRLIYDAKAPEDRDTAIELRHVHCTVPLSMLGSSTSSHEKGEADTSSPQREDSVISMTDVGGQLTLRGTQLELDISGLINEATCSLTGYLENVGGSLDEVGINLQIRGRRVPAPERAMREQLLADSSVPKDLRCFLNDYSPQGTFDLDFQLVRSAGMSKRAQLTGTLRPQGASTRCRWFPYPIEDLHGVVRFESHQVYIEDIRGRHGPALISANGRVDRTTRCASVELDVEASAIPLDTVLFEQLSDLYKTIWRRFDPQGVADISVKVRRPGAREDEPWPSYHTTVTADLVNAQICFSEYPYPLEGVQGRLEIHGNRIRFVDLTGHRGEASVRIDGHASIDPSVDPEVELRIEAKSMPLDETLAAAVPPDGRAVFAQFQPEGYVDLVGTISLRDRQQDLVYDLQAKLTDATLCYQHFPYRIHNVTSEVAIRPDNISVLGVSGRHGATDLSASGNVQRLADGFIADLSFDCKELALDQDLFDALPASLKEAWHLLRPAGSVRARTQLHYVSENGRQWQRHRTEIEAGGGSICFQGFPLPLSSVSANVLVTDRLIEIRSLRGSPLPSEEAEQPSTGTIELSGQIDLAGSGKRGTLRLSATDMTFNETLVKAMPAPLQQWFESVRPAGRFDLLLDPLRFEVNHNDKASWHFAGWLRLADARGDVGLQLRDVTGHVTGSGRVGPDGNIVLCAHTELDRAVLAGWHLENVSADIVAGKGEQDEVPPPSPTMAAGSGARTVLLVRDASGNAYGGEVGGSAEVQFGGTYPSYQLSVTARDVQFSRYMKVHGKAANARKKQPVAAQGSIYGNLILRGRGGVDPYRDGVGEVFVREAQIWKLPIVFALFQVLNLTPDENVFHDGWLKYSLSQDELTFQQIDLQGKALSFVGGGRMDLRTSGLDLTLLAGSPVRIRVPFLTDILEGASRELMEIKITGTLTQPRMTPQPLKSLSKALKTLFPEPPRPVDARPISSAGP